MVSSIPMPESRSEEKIAVIGLGYVGLPVALAFSRKFPTVGFDINTRRVDLLSRGRDDTASGRRALASGGPWRH